MERSGYIEVRPAGGRGGRAATPADGPRTGYVEVRPPAVQRGPGLLYAGGDLAPTGVGNNSVILWDGSAWSGLGRFDGTEPVRALAHWGGGIIAGGGLTGIGGESLSYIASWNGSAWSGLGSGHDGPVLCLATFGNDLIAGGSFTGRVVRWDGSSWTMLGSGLADNCQALAAHDGYLFACGAFGVRRWDGSTWTALASPGTVPYALASYNGDLICAGGTIGALHHTVFCQRWNGSAWSAMTGLGALGLYNAQALLPWKASLYAGSTPMGVLDMIAVAAYQLNNYSTAIWYDTYNGVGYPPLTWYVGGEITDFHGYALAAYDSGGDEHDLIVGGFGGVRNVYDLSDPLNIGAGTCRALLAIDG